MLIKRLNKLIKSLNKLIKRSNKSIKRLKKLKYIKNTYFIDYFIFSIKFNHF